MPGRRCAENHRQRPRRNRSLPGLWFSCQYIATTVMEVFLDARVYDIGMVTVIEIMGRNAGWLAAAAPIL